MRGCGLIVALVTLAVVGLVVPVGLGARAPEVIEIGGTIAKDVAFTDIGGKEHSFAEFRGKVVLLHFWSIVCPTEKVAEPKFISLQKTYGDKNVVQIAINANQGEIKAGPPYASLRDHVQAAGVNFLVGVDPGNKLTDLLNGQSTPHCFVFDRDGVMKYSGALDDDPRGVKGAEATAYVRDAIDAVLAGKPVATPTTKPYG